MRAVAAVTLAGLLMATAGLAGCIQGAFRAADLPSLPPGWAKDDANSESGERGLQPIIAAKYQVNAYQHGAVPVGIFYVVSVSDVPLLDEQGEIKKQLDAELANYNAQLAERGRGSGAVGSDAATFTWHDATVTISGIALTGFAIDAPWTCAANGEAVRVFGFASTQGAGGILGGGGTDESTWREVVGSGFPGQLGGMVAAVRCS